MGKVFTREFFEAKGRKGGRAKGASKRRTPEHYRRIALLGVEARKNKFA